MSDQLLFAVFPYIAILVGVFAPIIRYRYQRFKFSSISSQFLEGKELFWGSVPWHYGILFVLLGHFVGLVFPKQVLLFNSIPVRLVLLEVTGLAMALLALLGLILLIYRRFNNKRVKVVSTKSDYIILFILLFQVISGIGIAVSYRWGSNWYAASMAPYLKSIFMFKPNIGYVASFPILVKLHITNAFLILFLIPFTRFLHFLVVPLQYLNRPWQIVRWNWDPSKVKKAN